MVTIRKIQLPRLIQEEHLIQDASKRHFGLNLKNELTKYYPHQESKADQSSFQKFLNMDLGIFGSKIPSLTKNFVQDGFDKAKPFISVLKENVNRISDSINNYRLRQVPKPSPINSIDITDVFNGLGIKTTPLEVQNLIDGDVIKICSPNLPT
ncbi:MAG: hypothetical protein SFT81_06840 [Candidatus Caenarcaniphilales bacterium]|nr:hypothetical protein [Candidatus Caenarcaniphilales bacterium]